MAAPKQQQQQNEKNQNEHKEQTSNSTINTSTSTSTKSSNETHQKQVITIVNAPKSEPFDAKKVAMAHKILMDRSSPGNTVIGVMNAEHMLAFAEASIELENQNKGGDGDKKEDKK